MESLNDYKSDYKDCYINLMSAIHDGKDIVNGLDRKEYYRLKKYLKSTFGTEFKAIVKKWEREALFEFYDRLILIDQEMCGNEKR